MEHVVMMPGWLEPPDLPGIDYVFWDDGEPLPPDAMLARVTTYVPPYLAPNPEVMARLPALTQVQALMAGVDDLAPRVPPGVTLRRAAGLHDTSTAELAVGLMIASLRGIDVAARDMVEARWRHERRPALADRTVGVVGWGGVGQAVARRLSGFEVTVVGFSRSGSAGSLTMGELDRHLGDLDVVVLCVPLDATSRHLLDATRLAALPDGALVVNVGRGGLIDTEALVDELQSGRLRAALDVTDPEPPPPDHPLWRCPGLLITPHVGGDSEAFVPRARALVARQMRELVGQS
ncbi:MAG: NAD(P)-dependent oxidoreductase [Candidatus Nanopelagicales bacterium]